MTKQQQHKHSSPPSAASASSSPVDSLSPSFLSKQRTALDQLCDLTITTSASASSPTSSSKTCVIQPKPSSSSSHHAHAHMAPLPVRVYAGEERRTRISRYLEKRKHKKWTRQVRYPSRQGSAEVRNRVKGRFVSKKSLAALAAASAASA